MSDYLGSLSADALGLLGYLKIQGGSASASEIRERFDWSGAKFGAVLFNMKRKATNRGLTFEKKVVGKKVVSKRGNVYVFRARVL